MRRITFKASDETATARLGVALAELLPDGVVVGICGTLGAGKTQLVREIAVACGVDRRQVTSPTFVLVQEHHACRSIYHFDAYRLKDEDEFLELGPEEYFDSSGLVLIEWADKVESCLPDQRIEIHIEVSGETSRRFEVIAVGDRYADVIRGLESLA
jgi:tRNA threonylcarbamoyladenosine biosynthesis protein TsaE